MIVFVDYRAVIFPPQTKIQGQVGKDAPVVLNIAGKLVESPGPLQVTDLKRLGKDLPVEERLESGECGLCYSRGDCVEL